MWTKSYVFHLLFIFNLAEKCLSYCDKISQNQVNKPPLRIIASDDEVLQPLIEKDDDDSNNYKQEISPQNPFRRSKRSKSKTNKTSMKRRNIDDDDAFSFLKMNLDLPSINSNSVIYANNQTINNPNNLSINENPKQEKLEVEDNFDSPFGSEIIKEVDTVLFRNHKVVSPGIIIASSSSSVAPGTVITSMGDTQNTVPGVDGFNIDFDLPIASSQSGKVVENKLPANLDVIINKTPTIIVPAKIKKVRSLDEFTIDGLTFDPANRGPKINLDTNITTNFISTTLIPFFKSGKILDRKSSYSV